MLETNIKYTSFYIVKNQCTFDAWCCHLSSRFDTTYRCWWRAYFPAVRRSAACCLHTQSGSGSGWDHAVSPGCSAAFSESPTAPVMTKGDPQDIFFQYLSADIIIRSLLQQTILIKLVLRSGLHSIDLSLSITLWAVTKMKWFSLHFANYFFLN